MTEFESLLEKNNLSSFVLRKITYPKICMKSQTSKI